MKKHKIIIYNIEYEFYFDERLEMWRINENKNIHKGFILDIEIVLKNFNSEINMLIELESFLKYIIDNSKIVEKNINDARKVLLALFITIYEKTYSEEVLNKIEFNFVGIDFKGHCTLYKSKYKFDFQFFPRYNKDPNKDIGSFLWKALFRDQLLLGVYSDTN